MFEGIAAEIKEKKEKIVNLEEAKQKLQTEMRSTKHRSNILEERGPAASDNYEKSMSHMSKELRRKDEQIESLKKRVGEVSE